ncbi:MAG: 2-C-methyl-D-erythritol 4-phosphate cytidylyltransferase [Oscillospiraceae bacterium]|nr:2-C-methyl-D-erythritol 4-phosphate cytidylyltransferase [Oscillospiraceae bacterium]
MPFEKKKRKTCVAILPAAGSSSRMKQTTSKLFCNISGDPVILITLRALQNSPVIDEIIIPTRPDMFEEISNLCRENGITKMTYIIPGGATRTESVLNGVLCAGGRFDLVAIHDAARPFVSADVIGKAYEAASKYNAAAPAVPVKDTIKQTKANIVERTVPRETLSAVQTPQIFDSDLITAALTKAQNEGTPITDDCSAVEALGMRVVLTEGDYFNIKITTPEDLIFAEAIYKNINRS